MGDLAHDTAVEPRGDGRFTATLDADWEIWGPMGGYVAACALRAAGATPDTDGKKPAAFSCHYYRPAAFGPIDVHVETRKPGRAATSQRVAITQDGKNVLDAMVWSVADVDGLEHDETTPPDVPGPDELADIRDLVPPGTASPYRFWENFDARPIAFEAEWPPPDPRPAVWQEWLRFIPTPTLDLNVAFHQPTTGHEWLLCDGAAPLSTGGLFGWTARVWSPGGTLHASGGGQCLYRRIDGS